jgi:predicted dehydrogenase
MESKMVKAGLVGLGWWGSNLLRLLADNGAISIVAATDIDPSRRQLAESCGARFLPTFEALLADPEVHALILCSPHGFHAEQILAAARAGKHIFCEKPLCLTKSDAERCIAACASANVVLGVGHERRFEPPILDLARRVESGELGQILQIEGNFNQDKFLALPPDNWRIRGTDSIGPLTATGIHVLDLSTAFLGRTSEIFATSRQLATNFENGDSLAILIKFESGTVALISAVLATPFDGRFAVYGSHGWAEVRDRSHPENSEGWVATYSIRGKDRETIDYPATSSVRANLESFARAVMGETSYPISTEQMVHTVEAFEAVTQSARSGMVSKINENDRG